SQDLLPQSHIDYLLGLKRSGFEPKVVYDIGANVLHWTKKAKEIWPDALYVLFEGWDKPEFLYRRLGYTHYHMAILSDSDEREVKWYENDYAPAGNSYYRELGYGWRTEVAAWLYPEDGFKLRRARTVDSIVAERGFPLPDLVKIDVQGSEVDVIR